MSNRVDVLAAALADRRSELEQAERKLAEHSELLDRATAELAASNGDFEVWQAIDQRVRFERRQVERYQGIVEQCSRNIDCGATALATAQREASIAELERLDAQQAECDREAFAKAAERYRDACALLASVQPSVEHAKRTAEQLRKLGVVRAPRHPIHTLWLALMDGSPGQGPAYWADTSKFEADLVGNIQDAMQLVAMDARQIAKLRQRLGDATAVIPASPDVAPAKPVQLEDYREEVADRSYQGFRYRYETWCCAPDSRTEYRLLLPDESSLPVGVSIRSEEHVELEHGLAARLCETSDGSQVLLAPRKALAEVATSAIRAAAQEVRSLLGLNEDQPSLSL